MKTLAERLKRRRLERGLTREALRSLSGVPKASIARFETDFKVSFESFTKIAMSWDIPKIWSCSSESRNKYASRDGNNQKNANRKRGARKQ